eukprot:5526432-Prymnesium_polylepis.2
MKSPSGPGCGLGLGCGEFETSTGRVTLELGALVTRGLRTGPQQLRHYLVDTVRLRAQQSPATQPKPKNRAKCQQ